MTLEKKFHLLGAVLASVLLLACAGRPDGAATPMAAAPVAAAAGKPKLIVFLVVVDGLPQRQVLAYRDQLVPDGFNRFLERGAWFANAHGALKDFSAAYLTGNSRVANLEFARARSEIASTGRADLIAPRRAGALCHPRRQPGV